MNITTTFRHMEGTDAVRSYAEDKVAKLQKFLRQAMTAQITLSVVGNYHTADVHLSAGPTRVKGKERSEDMYASIDLVVDKLERQITAGKDAHVARRRHGMRAAEFAVSESDRGRAGPS